MYNIEDFYDLVESGLVTMKHHNNLVMFKYKNKVFYDNLWHTNDLLRECRGIVFDKTTGEVAQAAMTKTFNVGENGTRFPGGSPDCYRKINGFMLCTTWHNDKPLLTTTGSFDSDFQKLGESYFKEKHLKMLMDNPHISFTFEVCDPSDPHIVYEEPGLYLLTARYKNDGSYIRQCVLDDIALVNNVKRPDLCEYDSTADHEGFMFYDRFTGRPIAKVKTKHYLSKKALMRMGKRQISVMFNDSENFKNRLDEEFYTLLEKILDTFTEDEYRELTEQQRRSWIEAQF